MVETATRETKKYENENIIRQANEITIFMYTDVHHMQRMGQNGG